MKLQLQHDVHTYNLLQCSYFLSSPYKLCFYFIFSFNFSVIQGGSLSSKVTSLFGIQFENMLIIVLLKIFTCWWTFLLENINFQSTWFIAVIIAFTTTLLKSKTKHSYRGGCSILRLSLQYITWWWQFHVE